VAQRLILVLVLLFVLPAVATAATVKVRVEGKTQTLFAPQEVTVTAANALDALEQASLLGEFYYHVTTTSFGPYIDQVGRYGGSGSSGWVFKVDDKSAPVGADQVQLADGDHVLWYYADFGATGGPPTLEVKAAKQGCYTVHAYDDNGATATVSGLQLHIGSKRTVKATPDTSICPGPHPGVLVRSSFCSRSPPRAVAASASTAAQRSG
jgi:hypothetical protein